LEINVFLCVFICVFRVQRLTIPSSCPEKYSQLMSACWKVEPKERPNFYSVLTLLDELSEGDCFTVLSCCSLFLCIVL